MALSVRLRLVGLSCGRSVTCLLRTEAAVKKKNLVRLEKYQFMDLINAFVKLYPFPTRVEAVPSCTARGLRVKPRIPRALFCGTEASY